MKCNSKYISLRPLLVCMLPILICLGSCRKSNDDNIVPKNDEISVTFSLKLPSNYSGIRTYAITGGEVEEVDVLVFTVNDDGEHFSYRSIGENIEPGDDPYEISFTTSLRKDENIENKYRLIILANVRQQLNAYGVNIGQTKEYFKHNFIYTKSTPGDNWDAALPMWGESDEISEVGPSTEITGINLLRSMAGVDVVNQAAVDFTLVEVYVFNSKTKGLVIPNSDSPSLPIFASPDDNEILTYVPSIPNELKNEIYLFEAAAGDNSAIFDPNATALVIGGTFTTDPDPDNPTMYYYRIDFRDEFGDLMPLLRNNRYTVNISRVIGTGIGYARLSKEDAFGSQSLPKYLYIGSNGIKSTQSKRSLNTSTPMGSTTSVKSPEGLQYTITTINEQE